jgi:hypothetical protein
LNTFGRDDSTAEAKFVAVGDDWARELESRPLFEPPPALLLGKGDKLSSDGFFCFAKKGQHSIGQLDKILLE